MIKRIIQLVKITLINPNIFPANAPIMNENKTGKATLQNGLWGSSLITQHIILFALCLFVITIHRAFAAGGICPASVPTGITNCYYIDYAGGSDSNNGTSKDTPWKHAPGMTGVTNNVGPGTIDDNAGSKCGSNPCNYSNTGFIFKGGVTWTHDAFPMTMRLKGTSLSDPVYWGVDPTWYAGTSWNRPIFDFGGSNGTLCTPMVQFAPVQFVIWDNFEFTNLYWDHTCNLKWGKISKELLKELSVYLVTGSKL